MKSSELKINEYAPFYKNYITSLGDVDLFEILNSSLKETINTIKDLPEEKLMYKYAEGKWTIKEILQHTIDTERIMNYRALRFSRNDTTELQGFDENWYVNNSNGNERDFNNLIKELIFVREASVLLFESFTKKMQTIKGPANGSEMTVRALGFMIAGHQLHHVKVIKERYL